MLRYIRPFSGLKLFFDGHSLVMAVVEVVWLEMVMVQVMVVEGFSSFGVFLQGFMRSYKTHRKCTGTFICGK